MINIRGDPGCCCCWLPLATSSRIAANGNQQRLNVQVFFRRPKILLATNLVAAVEFLLVVTDKGLPLMMLALDF